MGILKRAIQMLICLGFTTQGQSTSELMVQLSFDSIKPPQSPFGEYSKARTQFDGIVNQNSVTYLQVQENSTNYFGLSNAEALNADLDMTVQFWFKLSQLPTGNKVTQIVQIQNGLQCYIDSQNEFTCQADINQKLAAQTSDFIANKWYYFTLSVSKAGVTYLLISDNNEIIAKSTSDNFKVQQSSTTGWSACFGSCTQGQVSFQGGIREFSVFGSFIMPEVAIKHRNSEVQYAPDVQAYFRLQGLDKTALTDQFTDKPLISNPALPLDDLIGQDYIPADVCQSTLSTQTFVVFDGKQGVAAQKLNSKLNLTSYSYTAEVVVNIEPTTCFTNDVNVAKESCNLVLLDGVFMIYMQRKNMARVHFFAHKSYYESQSSAFFIPFNTWITIQMTMSQFGGWQLVLLNLQTGQTLTSLSQSYNLQRQFPNNNLSLFSGFIGIASNFTLFNRQVQLPIQYQQDKVHISALVKLSFYMNDGGENKIPAMLQDQGRNKGSFSFNQNPKFLSAPFSVKEDGNTPVYFDGVACEDKHRSLLLQQKSSTLIFQIKAKPEGSTMDHTIEFWFKTSFDQQAPAAVFALTDSRTGTQYWQVLMNQSSLLIYPISTANKTNGTTNNMIEFQEFNANNSDQFGWWHLSCVQSKESQQCTLHNSVIEVTKTFPSQISVPNTVLTASFGKSYASKQALGVVGLMVKHFRFWSRAVSQKEIKQMRQRQLDLTTVKGLEINLRFDQSNLFENQIQKGTKLAGTKVNSAILVPDFKVNFITSYDKNLDQVQYLESKLYHSVCPYNTYPLDSYCYNQPVNQAFLAIFPKLNSKQELEWIFSLNHSSLLDDSLMPYLTPIWQSKNKFIQSLFAKNQTEITIPANLLHQESSYSIKAGFKNTAGSFQEADSVNFVPNLCRWFEVYKEDSSNGRLDWQLPQGTQDIQFSLQLKQNPSLNCSSAFNFYDQFNGLDFQFITSNSTTRITNAPKLKVEHWIQTLGQWSMDKTEFLTAKDLFLNILLPASEQEKLPSWTDIKILMSVNWKSSQFDSSPGDQSIFQHVLYTVKFVPENTVLQVNLTSNKEFITIGQPLVLNASQTTVSNIQSKWIEKSLTYKWICPENFTSICQQNNGPVLAITWDQIEKLKIDFSFNYTFSVEVTWSGPSGVAQTKNATMKVVWYNTVLPNFFISQTPKPILYSVNQTAQFSIQPANFKLLDLDSFNVIWLIQPPLLDYTQSDSNTIQYLNGSQTLQIKAGSWQNMTNYTISVQLTYKNQQSIKVSKEVNFSVYSAPQNGSVAITPMNGTIGDSYTVKVTGWQSLSKTLIYYNVYTTNDSEGLYRGSQVNKQVVTQGKSLVSKFQNTNPLQVVVSDMYGEQTQILVFLQVVLKPNISSNSSNQTNETNSSTSTNKTNSYNSTNETNSSNSTNETKIENDPYVPNEVLQEPNGNSRRLQSELGLILQNIVNTHNSSTIQDLLSSILDTKQCQKGQTWQDQALQIYDLIVVRKTLAQYLQALPLLDYISANTKNDDKQKKEVILSRLQSIVQPVVYKGKYLSIESVRFNTELASAHKQSNMTSLDARYQMDATALFAMMSQSSSQSSAAAGSDHSYNLQVISMMNAMNKTEVEIRVIDDVSQAITEVGQLNGRIEVSFDIDPVVYKHGQTVCQTNVVGNEENWSSETCLTELQIDNQAVECTCNMIGASFIRLHDDYSLPTGDVVQFPSVIINQRKLNAQIKGFSYFLITLIAAISLFNLIGSAFLWKKDRTEQISTTTRQPSSFEAEIITQVSKILQQPKELVQLRYRSLLEYYFSDYSEFRHMLFGIHPMISPFSQVNPTQTRLLRFSAYQLQVNFYVIGCIMIFGSNYRITDSFRTEFFLDGLDIAYVNLTALASLILLLPILSEPIFSLLQDKISIDSDGQTTITKQRPWLRVLFTIFCLVINIITVLVAVHQCMKAPASNQYLMAWSLVGGTIGAALLSNTLRVLLCCYLRLKLPLLINDNARQITTDLSAVLKVKKSMRCETEVKPSVEVQKEEKTIIEVSQYEQVNVSPSKFKTFDQIEMCPTSTEIHFDEVPDSARLSFVPVPQRTFTVKKLQQNDRVTDDQHFD